MLLIFAANCQKKLFWGIEEETDGMESLREKAVYFKTIFLFWFGGGFFLVLVLF